jgi:hypothetical protein
LVGFIPYQQCPAPTPNPVAQPGDEEGEQDPKPIARCELCLELCELNVSVQKPKNPQGYTQGERHLEELFDFGMHRQMS